jgi:excisionase family DNA binding protein
MESSARPSVPDIRTGDVEVVTIAETAALLRVSKMTVYRLVHADVLPVTRVGRSYCIHRADLSDYLGDRDEPPAATSAG